MAAACADDSIWKGKAQKMDPEMSCHFCANSPANADPVIFTNVYIYISGSENLTGHQWRLDHCDVTHNSLRKSFYVKQISERHNASAPPPESGAVPSTRTSCSNKEIHLSRSPRSVLCALRPIYISASPPC